MRDSLSEVTIWDQTGTRAVQNKHMWAKWTYVNQYMYFISHNIGTILKLLSLPFVLVIHPVGLPFGLQACSGAHLVSLGFH